MATLVTAVATEFTPAVGDFNVQCTGGEARLDRKQTVGAAFAVVGYLTVNDSKVVGNPIAGAVYRFTTVNGTPVVQADQ